MKWWQYIARRSATPEREKRDRETAEEQLKHSRQMIDRFGQAVAKAMTPK